MNYGMITGGILLKVFVNTAANTKHFLINFPIFADGTYNMQPLDDNA